MAANDLVVALTGASGSPYGVRLLEVLLRAGRTVHLTMSPAAVEVFEREIGRTVRLDRFELSDLMGETAGLAAPGQVRYHHFRNFQAGIASSVSDRRHGHLSVQHGHGRGDPLGFPRTSSTARRRPSEAAEAGVGAAQTLH
jgi:3-polyprenyl-4-hydroxybenzoate decarboxylase